jgi:uncharacterized protein DUF1616
MTLLGVAEAVAGGLLLFFLPGYALVKALFPEWRVLGPDGNRRLLELVTLSFVTSIGLTILVGFGILDIAPGGFAAAWSDPLLEVSLAAVTVVGFGAALARGAFAKTPPVAPRVSEGGGEEGAWELTRELERLNQEERRLQHALRITHGGPEERHVREDLEKIRSETEDLRRRREAEYAE